MNYNKLFLVGFDDSNFLENVLKKQNSEICREENLIKLATERGFPPLFFVEKYEIFLGNFIHKYIKEIDFRYPFSKFVVNVCPDSNWQIKYDLLNFFIPSKDSEISKYLLFTQASDYNIGKTTDKSFLSHVSEKLFAFEGSRDENDLMNFISG